MLPSFSLCPVPREKIQFVERMEGGNGIIPIHVRSARGREEGWFALLLAISNARGERSSEKVPNGSGQPGLVSASDRHSSVQLAKTLLYPLFPGLINLFWQKLKPSVVNMKGFPRRWLMYGLTTKALYTRYG